MAESLAQGPLGPGTVHVCVDMQRMFAEHTDWYTPWMLRVLPTVRRLAEHRPERTVFTRFIPADRPGEGVGAWRRYYEHWASMTVERLGRDMLDLLPELAALVPPAQVVNKCVYSPWFDPDLQRALAEMSADTLVVTGGETDVCVLSTVLGAVDHGFRVVLATDGLCSSADETHDASLRLYESRFGQQVETAEADSILRAWG